MHGFANAVADVIFDDAEFASTKYLFDSIANVTKVYAGCDLVDTSPESGFSGFYHLLDGWISVANYGSESGVGVISFIFYNKIKADFITRFECIIAIRSAVH